VIEGRSGNMRAMQTRVAVVDSNREGTLSVFWVAGERISTFNHV